MNNSWDSEMKALVECANFYKFCDVIDIEFDGGFTREVHVVVSWEQRDTALGLEWIDTNLDGCLYYFDEPTFIPVWLSKQPLSVAWYDEAGTLLKHTRSVEPNIQYCPKPFSYLYKAPVGTIPMSNLKVKNART